MSSFEEWRRYCLNCPVFSSKNESGRTEETMTVNLPPKPQIIKLQALGIPAELRDREQWVVWRFLYREGQSKPWTKTPWNPLTGSPTSTADPDSWTTFINSAEPYQTGRFDGIGFVFSPDDPYVGIDLDNCRDTTTGAISLWAQQIINRFDIYTEVSVTGSGVHLIMRGSLPPGRRRKDRIEMYDSGRYFCMSGHRLDSAQSAVADCHDELQRFHAETFPQNQAQSNGSLTNGRLPGNAKILEIAGMAKNGDKFRELWNGDFGNYPSQSEADQALCNLLAFYVGPDPSAVDRLFRQSGLMRAKRADRDDYRTATIQNAISGTTEFFDWSRWNRQASSKNDGRPEIVVTTDEYVVNNQAVLALAKDTGVFQRGGMLVQIVRDAGIVDGIQRAKHSPRIAVLPLPIVRERLAANARFVEIKQLRDGEIKVKAHPPDWCSKTVHARANYSGIRPIEGVVETPILRPNGTILSTPGYDLTTGLLYEPVGEVPRVLENPTHRQAIDACAVLLDIVRDFPFAKLEHQATWLASLLTPLARFAVDGPAPLFLIDANVPGSGKTLLASVTGIIVSGRDMPRMSNPKDDDETRKRITALVIAGDPLILIDNINQAIGSAALDAALTGTFWKDRLLGKNQIVDLPIAATWYATGNNVVVKGDPSRRIAHIRFDSRLENPEQRAGFKYADLKAHVQSNRKRLLEAALTILRAFCRAGRPQEKLKPWGSFERWSDLVRQVIVWCGLPDPGESRQELQEHSDSERSALAALIDAWPQIDPEGRGLTTSAIIKKLEKSPAEYEAVLDAVLELCGKLDSRSLGRRLSQFRGRILGCKTIDKVREQKGAIVWKVNHIG